MATTMGDPATRVALLARPGIACERLRAALLETGAEVVLVADPSEADVAEVRATGAQAILIALEPMIEDALDRYDALLADPAITVIFDEAELAAQREGWDAARWTRHLAAKLHRHEQVLPPGAEIEPGFAGEPQRLNVYQRPESDGDITTFAGEVQARSPGVPTDIAGAPRQSGSEFDPVMAELDTTSAPTLLALDDPAVDHPAAAAAPTVSENVVKERFLHDLDALHLRIADMQLEDARLPPLSSQDGAVVVLAGIGGPDAVRQLLGGLPATFPRAVLIQQRLEGAKHDKLVRQMQRATAMPVHLAEAGESLQRGHVYVLPAHIGVAAQPDGLHFAADAGDSGAGPGPALIANLPADDSAVILLSGTDPAAVDAAMAHALRGALVAGQTPDGCFDAIASEALVARGGEAAAPAQLAKKLAARWPS